MALRALWDVTQQFQNKNGSNLTSGKIYIYYQGRTALATTYHDEDGTVVNSNPVLLDNNGRATAFADPIYSYTIVVCDYYGKELFSQDITLHDAISSAEDVVVLGTDGTVLVDRTELPNGVQYDLSVNTDILATKEYVDDEVDNLQEQIDDKKDKQTALSFNGAATKTIKKVTQNANGEINIEFEDIDLPPEVPNVEITSPNGTLDIHSSTDVETNTKTFTIDVNKTELDYINYGHGTGANTRYSSMPTGQLLTLGVSGTKLGNHNLTLASPAGYEPGSKVALDTNKKYIMAVEVRYSVATVSNNEYKFDICCKTKNGANDAYAGFTIDASYEHEASKNFTFMIESCNETYVRLYSAESISTWSGVQIWVNSFFIIEQSALIGGSGSGGSYSAGDGIDITSNTISVDAGKGLGFDADGKLEVKVGTGLEIDDDNNVITIDTEVGDVVETVEKLKRDLDTQLTVNFDMPNVDNVYDFADPTVIGMSNGAVMLCQAFTVPINHDIRVDDGETENPTLLGIYAKQAFTGKKIMLALYVYDFDTGYTDYVGDTGPVEVIQGRNEFALKHINPNIAELKSSCVYYASLYLPSNAHSNGLYLAGCPSYSNASYINATPRFTVGVENITYNNTEIDMADTTTGRLDYNDGNGNYYIGPWSDNYNERPAIPRFFMQIRNGEADTPIVVEPFTDIGTFTLKNTSSITDVFGSTITVNTSTYGAVFMEVTPAQDVDVTGWVCYDNYSTDVRQWYGMVFDSAFENQLSTASAGTLTELGEITTGIYGHEFTRTSPLHLTANTTYRFLVGIPHSNSDMLVQYNTPTVSKNLHLFESGYNVSQWVTYSRANNVQGIDFLIKDANNEWRI